MKTATTSNIVVLKVHPETEPLKYDAEEMAIKNGIDSVEDVWANLPKRLTPNWVAIQVGDVTRAAVYYDTQLWGELRLRMEHVGEGRSQADARYWVRELGTRILDQEANQTPDLQLLSIVVQYFADRGATPQELAAVVSGWSWKLKENEALQFAAADLILSSL